ncbi:hypothetical protein [Thiothrix fructosivorans]|uniref:Uncharacterized protein n=1 Tax=Thiothrix fructosivorans TaxID=111770 RepID=A0A8B0SKS8_9GAMM|nr:hypothetical protein [Thiothrix fructosivorans]MBO0611683.1 hypothetical protein [Thiothrix fructosivorans]QTX10658.1 hypothetical protein J1836_019170 [Thiothrix fructosivorans]
MVSPRWFGFAGWRQVDHRKRIALIEMTALWQANSTPFFGTEAMQKSGLRELKTQLQLFAET